MLDLGIEFIKSCSIHQRKLEKYHCQLTNLFSVCGKYSQAVNIYMHVYYTLILAEETSFSSVLIIISLPLTHSPGNEIYSVVLTPEVIGCLHYVKVPAV